MEDSLAKKSDFLKVKSKFFINRLVIYFSFLLVPLWLQESVKLNLFSQALVLLLYMFFMVGQWYLLGKEIDHRLKDLLPGKLFHGQDHLSAFKRQYILNPSVQLFLIASHSSFRSVLLGLFYFGRALLLLAHARKNNRGVHGRDSLESFVFSTTLSELLCL